MARTGKVSEMRNGDTFIGMLALNTNPERMRMIIQYFRSVIPSLYFSREAETK